MNITEHTAYAVRLDGEVESGPEVHPFDSPVTVGDLEVTVARFDITVTNVGSEPVELAGNMGYDVFSGTTSSEYLICDEGGSTPGQLQPGRSAEWSECFGVEDRADVFIDVYPMHGGEPVTFGA